MIRKANIFERLTSLWLTLALLLGLAVISVFGTLQSTEQGRFDLYYQSLWYRLLLGALAINLAACTFKTIMRNLRDRQRFAAVTEEYRPGGELAASVDRDREEVLSALKSARYRLSVPSDDHLLVEMGRSGRWGSTVVHLSCLLIMAGGLASEFGFVGTRFIYVGQQDHRVLDWETESERDLGFTLRVDEFTPQYYPIDLQITAYRPGSRQELKTWTTREGQAIDLPASGIQAEVVDFDPFTNELRLRFRSGGTVLGDYRAAVGERTFREGYDPGVVLYPTAFKDPILKQASSRVTVLEQGRSVASGEISVNHPLVHQGVSIYQTAFDRDKYGFWYVGFQFTKDPGEPVVWFGSVTLVLGLLLAFLRPYRVCSIQCDPGQLRISAVKGFRGDAGRRAFIRLVAKIEGRG